MEIVPYSTAHRGAVQGFNAKLAAAGSRWQFPEVKRPPDAGQRPVWSESFVAVEGDEAYGGYILKHQQFFVRGRPLELDNLDFPLSLGEVDKRFSHVSVALLFDALRRNPHCYCLGLGSEQAQLAKLLTAAGWKHLTIPFYFSVKSTNRFARNIRLPAEKARLERALRTLSHLRLAGIAMRLRRVARARSASSARPAAIGTAREVPRFDERADRLFTAHAEAYSLIGDRRAAALSYIYPEEETRFIRVVVERGDGVVGWAVLLDTKMRNDNWFGNLRVGSLVDCFAPREDAFAVVSAADRFLTDRGVDLVVSNQMDSGWGQALERAGYESGPSNFFLYFSKAVSETLADVPGWEQDIHVNRGDGEGPIHLMGVGDPESSSAARVVGENA